MSANQDFAALKKLLISWNVEILYDFFKEENISIEELKMIKLHHVSYLLKNYKMGVKIRFEYHLENWRNQIGKPLQSEDQNFVMCNSHCKSSLKNCENLESRFVNKTNKRKRTANEMPTDHLELEYNSEQPPPQSPQSTKSNSSYHEVPVSNEMPSLTPIPVLNISGQEYSRKNNEKEEAAPETETLTTLTHLLAASLGDSHREETTSKYTSKFAPDNTLPVSLAQILQLSGTRGMAIIKYYDENKRLTNTHRTQLIQTIVEFFDDNDYHLSLNMSHNLEWQLLKMFPTEKLEYYRTEKRGKIYVKFSNMKRYKRERNNRPSKIESEKSFINTTTQQNVSGITDTNMDATSYDAWPEGADVEIEVKPELFSDDDV